MFANNQRHGIGKTIFPDQSYFFGSYTNDERHGEGLFFYKNRDRYSGFWKNGKKHGKGTYIIDSSNMKLKGNWSEGQFLKGEWEIADDFKFEGKFYKNRPNGKGMFLKGGVSLEGEYKQVQIRLENPNEVIYKKEAGQDHRETFLLWNNA